MADKIHFDLVSPEKLLLSEDVEMVTVPGREGEFGVLAGHAPVIATLKPGVITVKGGTDGDSRIFVRGGFAEVNPLQITVLAEEAVPLAGLDVAALDQRIRDAEEDLALAKTEAERALVADALANLKQIRAVL
jgi:F-type H+-transporting ATPase subunit epsilon